MGRFDNMGTLDNINSIISTCLSTETGIRGPGVRKFVEGYSDDLGREMVRHLRSSDKEIRARSMAALAAAVPASLPVLVSLMDDGDWIVRYRAAEALGLGGAQEAVEVLRAHLTDSKDHVRYMAVKSLGILHADNAGEGIAERLCKDENPYVRRMAVRTLTLLGGAGQEELFRRVLVSETDETVIAALNEALGEAGYDGA